MVLAHHVILCFYGFWLPNDPRGSWSDFVGAWELLRFGNATKTNTRRSVAANAHDANRRRAAKAALKYPAILLQGRQARAIARGFSQYVDRSDIGILACSILPQHVHTVVTRHRFDVEHMANQLKGYATRQLVAEGLHPFSQESRTDGRTPTCWARGQWKVFLDTSHDIERAIRYVNNNPAKEGLRPQNWNFVHPHV